MEKKVEFKAENETLRGSLFIPNGKGPFPSVIFFHGSGSTGETYFETAKKLSESGILGFAFNFRGCGISDGKFEYQTIGMGVEDAKTAIDFFLSQQEVDKERIGLSGSSYGGFMASLLWNRVNPKSLLLIAPAAYSPKASFEKHSAITDIRKDYAESDSYTEISKFKGNLLVLKCEFEDLLPIKMIDNYFELAGTDKKEKYVLKGAGHVISKYPDAKEILKNKIVDWFSETL